MELARTGVWSSIDDLSSNDAVAFAKRIEALGYSALWLPEAVGRDPFVLAAQLLDHTSRLVVATGVANIYARDPMAMKAAQHTLAEQSGGRFLLGIGVSHQLLVEEWRGHQYGPPLASMRRYLDRFDQCEYGGRSPAENPPLVLAALGPKMLELARERADGAHPYMVTPEHTRRAREILGPDRLLCTEQKLLHESDADKARAIARRSPAISMGLSLPNYRRSLTRQGFEDADFEGGFSDRLVDAVVASGDIVALAGRVQAHYDAGATHVCIHIVPTPDSSGPDWRLLEALAPG
ncbi:MAG: TIGR03620 family F420-dependent LLM class oxidoreductase [Myxococcota bacterium]|nr:TIGR03620 family F420-dependent LLM class oxidoreductase [Myxococcota bacterium]